MNIELEFFSEMERFSGEFRNMIFVKYVLRSAEMGKYLCELGRIRCKILDKALESPNNE